MLVFLASYMLINSESGVQGDYVIIMIPLERPARTVISARESNGTQRERERENQSTNDKVEVCCTQFFVMFPTASPSHLGPRPQPGRPRQCAPSSGFFFFPFLDYIDDAHDPSSIFFSSSRSLLPSRV